MFLLFFFFFKQTQILEQQHPINPDNFGKISELLTILNVISQPQSLLADHSIVAKKSPHKTDDLLVSQITHNKIRICIP